jgi:alpha-L-rhamnosidase
MMASVSAWFYKYLGGINGDPQSPGFRKIVICPYPVRGLDWVQSEYASMYGMIRSSWKKEAGSFQLEVEIPANCTATVYLPAQKLNQVTEGDVPVTQSPGIKWLRDESGRVVLETGSGQYRFRVQP